MKHIRLFSALMFVTLLLSASLAAAAPPKTLSYQGSLYNADGSPFTGVKKMTFKLYDAAEQGTALWTEIQDGVYVGNGRFATVLGNTTALNLVNFTSDVYLGIQVDGEVAEMSPRQKMTSVPFALSADNGVPVGGIIMWSGTIAEIPTGWALCDGGTVTIGTYSKTTPNLTNRFVIAAGATGTYTPGVTGGEEKVTLTVSQMPKHNHSNGNYRMLLYDGNSTSDATDYTSGEPNIVAAGVNPAYNGGDQPHNNMPPYYALAFIMRIY